MIQLSHIGTILKAHGKDGQLRISVDDGYLDDLEKARAVFINLDGSKVPFLIEGIEYKNHILIKLDEVDTPEQASKYSLKELYMEDVELSESNLNRSISSDADQMIGMKVFDQNDVFRGIIQELIQNEFQDLVEIRHEDEVFLCPLHEELIISIDSEEATLKLTIPEGL